MPIPPKKLKALVDKDQGRAPKGNDAFDLDDSFVARAKAAADEHDEDLAHANPEPSPETRKKIRKQMSGMPGQMREGFRKWAGRQSFEALREKAEELAAEGKIDDPERFAGWMYWAGKS